MLQFPSPDMASELPRAHYGQSPSTWHRRRPCGRPQQLQGHFQIKSPSLCSMPERRGFSLHLEPQLTSETGKPSGKDPQKPWGTVCHGMNQGLWQQCMAFPVGDSRIMCWNHLWPSRWRKPGTLGSWTREIWSYILILLTLWWSRRLWRCWAPPNILGQQCNTLDLMRTWNPGGSSSCFWMLHDSSNFAWWLWVLCITFQLRAYSMSLEDRLGRAAILKQCSSF